MSDLTESRRKESSRLSVVDSGSSSGSCSSKMELKRKEPEDGGLILGRSSISFRKKPRMRCIDWRDRLVFHFEILDEHEDCEEDWEVEEDEANHDATGESDADEPDDDKDESFEGKDNEHKEEADHEELSLHKSSINCNIRPRIRCYSVRDFPPLLHQNPADAPPAAADAPSEAHEEESEREEDDWDEGVDESHMDIFDDDGSALHRNPADTDVDEVESQSNLDVESNQDGNFDADETETDEVDSSESSIKCIRRPRCFAVRHFPPCLLWQEEVEPVEDDYSDESVVLDPREDDSDKTESDLEMDNNEDDEHRLNELVETEDDETSDEYIDSDDEADQSGYITCL